MVHLTFSDKNKITIAALQIIVFLKVKTVISEHNFFKK